MEDTLRVMNSTPLEVLNSVLTLVLMEDTLRGQDDGSFAEGERNS